MIKLKKYFKTKYPKIYFYLKFFYYFDYFLTIIFYSIKYKNKKYKINQPLILITQIQRSGGTLLNSLFDGSNQVFSYPHELMIFNPKKLSPILPVTYKSSFALALFLLMILFE